MLFLCRCSSFEFSTPWAGRRFCAFALCRADRFVWESVPDSLEDIQIKILNTPNIKAIWKNQDDISYYFVRIWVSCYITKEWQVGQNQSPSGTWVTFGLRQNMCHPWSQPSHSSRHSSLSPLWHTWHVCRHIFFILNIQLFIHTWLSRNYNSKTFFSKVCRKYHNVNRTKTSVRIRIVNRCLH